MRLEQRRIWFVDRSGGRTSQPIGMSVKLSDAKDSMVREPGASDPAGHSETPEPGASDPAAGDAGDNRPGCRLLIS